MGIEADFELARRRMVENQIRCCKVLDPKIVELFATMPREAFVPEHVRSLAYMEGRVPLPHGQEMLSPLQEAHILQALRLTPKDRVLEIGAGTGFLTALLAMLAREVVSCEIHAELAALARANLEAHGIDNAKVVEVNAMDAGAMDAHPELTGPFDAIVIGAAVPEVPPHLLARLGEHGRMAVFLGGEPVVRLELWEKRGGSFLKLGLMETSLLPAEGIRKPRVLEF